MHNPITVEFISRTTPASNQAVAARADLTQHLDDLGHIDASTGEVNTRTTQWYARIGGTELALIEFSLQHLDDGKVAISLAAVVDRVQVGAVPDGPVAGGEPGDEERLRMVTDRLEFAERATKDVGLRDVTLRPANPAVEVFRG